MNADTAQPRKLSPWYWWVGSGHETILGDKLLLTWPRELAIYINGRMHIAGSLLVYTGL